MKSFVHTSFFALILTIGILPKVLLSQDNLSNWYIQEVFLLADLNQDKYLSESEILELRENFAYYQNPENFDLADNNKDRYLDYQEFRYRFGQALVHRQEIDGKELKVLSENYPYFENAAYKYLKRHPELAAQLMNNLLWTREHPELMKQIIGDKSWLAKEPAIAESLSSNLIWLTENPALAKKFYQTKKINSVSDIWKSWGITHLEYLNTHKAEEGIQIDFPFWPTEAPSSTELIAEAPSPGEQQKWVDSLLMNNESLQLSYEKVQAELERRDSIGEAVFANQELALPTGEENSLKTENEALRTRVRQMLIEKRLARIEEDKLLKTTIQQRKQIAFLEKQQEFTEEEGNLTLKDKSSLEEEVRTLDEELKNKKQRIKDLDQTIAKVNQENLDLLTSKKALEKREGKLLAEKSDLEKEIDELVNHLAATEKSQIPIEKGNEWQSKIKQLEQKNAHLIEAQEKLEREKAEMESSISRIIEAKKEDNDELIAIEDQYKQQILALDIELEKIQAMHENEQATFKQKQTRLEGELQHSRDMLSAFETKLQDLTSENQLLTQNLAQAKSEKEAANTDAWTKERNALSEDLARSNQQIVALLAEQEQMTKTLRHQKEEQILIGKDEKNAWIKERDSLVNVLAQSEQQVVGLLADQKTLQRSLSELKEQENTARDWTDARLSERDSLHKSLTAAHTHIEQLKNQIAENEQALDEAKSLTTATDISTEFDALYLRVNELEYNNERLKDELEATLSLAGEREAILTKRLKSSMRESTRMANRMKRYKRRKNYKDVNETEALDKMALELDEEKARLKELNEVNEALLAQLQANNNYLGHNISKRDQYKQELLRLKSGLSKKELENDSLRYLLKHSPSYMGPNKDSLIAYQEKIFRLEQRLQLNKSSSLDQIARLNLEIDSLESEVITLEEEKTTLAQVKKVEASRSQLTGETERRLIQLEYQLKEKDLTLRQKEKVIEEKLKEIALKEKKYQDMRRWEEELHLLERKLKINPAYQKVQEEE